MGPTQACPPAPAEWLPLRELKIRALELGGVAVERQLRDLPGEVLGDAILYLHPREAGAYGLALQVYHPAEAPSGNVGFDSRIELGEPARELHAVDHLVRDGVE